MFWVAHSKETEHPKYLNSNSADPKLQRMLPAKCRSSPAAARRSLPAAPCCELTSRSPAPPRSRAGSSPSLPAVLLLTGRGPPLLAVSSRRIRRQLPVAPRRAAPLHGGDRPRHHQLRRRCHGGRQAHRRHQRRGRAHHALRRRLHQDRGAPRRPDRQAPGRRQPREHLLLRQEVHRPQDVRGRRRGQAGLVRRRRPATGRCSSPTPARCSSPGRGPRPAALPPRRAALPRGCRAGRLILGPPPAAPHLAGCPPLWSHLTCRPCPAGCSDGCRRRGWRSGCRAGERRTEAVCVEERETHFGVLPRLIRKMGGQFGSSVGVYFQ